MPNTLLCIHRGADDDTSMYWCQGTIDANGDISWSGDQRFMAGNAKSSEGPGLAIYNGQIICAHRDSESGQLMISYWDTALREWRSRGPITTSAPSTPGLYVGQYYGQNQKLFCFYEADRDNVMYWGLTDTPLGDWQFNLLAANKACSRMSGVSYAGITFCVHRGQQGAQPAWQECLWARYDQSNNWKDDRNFVDENGDYLFSSSGPAAASFDNELFLVRRGVSDFGNDDPAIYTTRYTWNGAKEDLSIVGKEYKSGNESIVGPTLVTCNSQLYCIYPSTHDSRLQWTRWRCDNNTWLQGQDFGGHRSGGEAAVIAIDNPL